MRIPASDIGAFRNSKQAIAYLRAENLRQKTEQFAEDVFSVDNHRDADVNMIAGKVVIPESNAGSYVRSGYAHGEASFDPNSGKVESLNMERTNWRMEVKTSRGFLGLGQPRTIVKHREVQHDCVVWEKATFYSNGDIKYSDRVR